jgi:hypothetical protein
MLGDTRYAIVGTGTIGSALATVFGWANALVLRNFTELPLT